MPSNRNPRYTTRHRQMFRGLRDQLLEELRVCRQSAGDAMPEAVIGQSSQDAADDVDASDIYKVEVAAYPYLSDHELRLRLLGLRDMVSNLTTPETYARLQSAFTKKLDNRKELLAEAYALASRLHRRYVLLPSIEEMRTSIAVRLLMTAAAAILAAIALVWWSNTVVELGYAVAIASGICGAVVSTIMRLYKFDSRHEPLLTWYNLERGRLSLLVTPFLGGVFATVLLLMMHGGLLQGDLFPKFPSKEVGPICWHNLRPNFGDPDCNVYLDVSKVVVWCFLSGWSERLVPDVLDKLTAYSAHKGLPGEPGG